MNRALRLITRKAPITTRFPTTAVLSRYQSTDAGKSLVTESELAQQAPNYPTTWSNNQRPRDVAMSGPRFEQTDLAGQPRPMAAIELINEEPIRFVAGRKAVCDGGDGPLGHPKVYINLDKSNEPQPCEYCGIRFQKDPSAHH
ncbi:hypothetical protein H4219_001563 [Mycoemilia scoparia]|uniref:Zinc finger CHCC-type domain-containing protein n=1 Tax=Mycoemilia scoparia TaxID=417184 RepID=A0A9W8DQ65_9FUNG|nr:hypothetical protein H4219_001563 [Mycoemilia scoparia]